MSGSSRCINKLFTAVKVPTGQIAIAPAALSGSAFLGTADRHATDGERLLAGCPGARSCGVMRSRPMHQYEWPAGLMKSPSSVTKTLRQKLSPRSPSGFDDDQAAFEPAQAWARQRCRAIVDVGRFLIRRLAMRGSRRLKHTPRARRNRAIMANRSRRRMRRY